jgi:hypothetical protein
LATHKETYVSRIVRLGWFQLTYNSAVNSPPDIQQLQLSSPTLETDNKPDWPTSFDTSTMGGSAPGQCHACGVVLIANESEVKEGKKGQ